MNKSSVTIGHELNKELSEEQRVYYEEHTMAVERILGCDASNYSGILDLEVGASMSDITKAWDRLSNLLVPEGGPGPFHPSSQAAHDSMYLFESLEG